MSPEPSRYEIARAVPGGSRRARDQSAWLKAAGDLIAAQSWYASRAASTAETARVLARYMDWTARTSRPGHQRIADLTGLSLRTVRRCVRSLEALGLLGLVSPGTKADLRAAVLYGGTGCVAAVYVLCVPREKRPLPRPGEGGPESVRLSLTGGQVVNPPREARPGSLRRSVLKSISDQGMAWAARKFARAGWSHADVARAVDYLPSGRQHRFSHGVRFPRQWLVSRLSHWLDASGVPLPSRSQRLAVERARLAADQAAMRDERRRAAEAAAEVDVARRVAELRVIVAERQRTQ